MRIYPVRGEVWELENEARFPAAPGGLGLTRLGTKKIAQNWNGFKRNLVGG